MSAQHPGKNKRNQTYQRYLAFGLLLIGAVVLRIIGIDKLGLGDHEMPTLLFCSDIAHTESNGFLYHNVSLPLWMFLFTDSVLSLRLASLMFSLGGIVGMYFLGNKIGSVRFGLAAAFFLAISDYDILLSQHIRFHEFNACLCIWGTFAFVNFLERPRWSSWLTFALIGVLCIGSMVLSYLLVCLLLLGGLVLYPSDRRFRLWILGHFGLFTVTFALLWYMDAGAYARIDDLALPCLGNLLSCYADFFAFSDRYESSYSDLFAFARADIMWAASALTLIWHAIRRRRKIGNVPRHSKIIWLCLVAIPVIWVESHILKPIFKPTNLSFAMPFFALMLALFLCELPRRLSYAALILLLILNTTNNSTPGYFDEYTTEACAQFIADYVQSNGDYPCDPYHAPSYIYGFPWGVSYQHLTEVRAHLDNATSLPTHHVPLRFESTFVKLVRKAKQGAFPNRCDIWYYKELAFEDDDITTIFEQLHPRYVIAFNYMGRHLCRIHMDNPTEPIVLRKHVAPEIMLPLNYWRSKDNTSP